MKLDKILELIRGEVVYRPEGFDHEINYAGASDLMSDVLAYLSDMPAHESKDMMLITGLVSPQSIRTAALTDMSIILFTRGKQPNPNIIESAKAAGLAVILTPLTSYTVCGLLYSNGVKGVDKELD